MYQVAVPRSIVVWVWSHMYLSLCGALSKGVKVEEVDVDLGDEMPPSEKVRI